MNNDGTSIGMVLFHLFMTVITGGAWIGILIIWLIIRACSGK